MKENLQKIKEACIKVNPEIMELKFGCEGNYDGNPVKWLRYGMDFQNVDGPNVHVWQMDNGTRYVTPDNNIVEILGRPIRLADVLLATQWKFSNGMVDADILGSEGVYLYDLLHDWNLKDDNLDHQPENTITFIASLL